MPDFSSLGSRLAYARSGVGLRQTDVAKALGLNHSIQVSKWENDQHAPTAKTLDRLADLFGVSVAWLLNGNDYPTDNNNVSRGTVRETSPRFTGYSLPAAVGDLSRDLERELIRLGASDFEVDYVSHVIRDPETSRIFRFGEGNRPLTEAEAIQEARSIMDSLRQWVIDRIARRQTIEPIKPKDVPAAMAKRRAELDADAAPKKRRTK